MLKEYRLKVARRMLREVYHSGVDCGMFYNADARQGRVIKAGPRMDAELRDFPEQFMGVYSIKSSLHDVIEDMIEVIGGKDD